MGPPIRGLYRRERPDLKDAGFSVIGAVSPLQSSQSFKYHGIILDIVVIRTWQRTIKDLCVSHAVLVESQKNARRP